MTQYGDYQFDIYFGGFEGQLPRYPVDFAALERAAAEVLPPWVYSYVAGGAGDEGTPRGNVEAFSRYGIVPPMLVGASERELSVSLFDMHLPTPLFMCPIGVIGLCSQDFHGDIQVAKASAQTGVPMVASTLTQDRMEDVAPHAGDTPGLFQLYTPTDKELTASLLHRAEQAGYRGVVITLDTWTLGWPTRTQTNHQVSPGKVTGPMDTVRHCTLRPAVAGIAHVLPTVYLGWWATLTTAASAETAVTHIASGIHQDQRSHNGEGLS